MLILYFFFLYFYSNQYLKTIPKQWMNAIHLSFGMMILFMNHHLILLCYLLLILYLCKESIFYKAYHFFMIMITWSIHSITLSYIESLLTIPTIILFIISCIIFFIAYMILPKMTLQSSFPFHSKVLWMMFLTFIINMIILYLLKYHSLDCPYFMYHLLSLISYSITCYMLFFYLKEIDIFYHNQEIYQSYQERNDDIMDENMVSLNKQLRHDLKNHILTLSILIKQQNPEVNTYIDTLKKGKDE